MKFTSNKVIDLGSAAFRQWRSTHSHCQYIHGYRLTANITFECDELDERNWCADFGGLKDLKKSLEYTFDHKLVVAADDPHIDQLKMIDETGVAQVVVIPAVGCERFAEYVLNKADDFISKATEGRVRVKSVQINEHENNFATAYRQDDKAESLTVTIEQSDTKPVVIDDLTAAALGVKESNVLVLEDNNGPVATVETSNAAPVQNKPSTKTKGGWFEGTTWG